MINDRSRRPEHGALNARRSCASIAGDGSKVGNRSRVLRRRPSLRWCCIAALLLVLWTSHVTVATAVAEEAASPFPLRESRSGEWFHLHDDEFYGLRSDEISSVEESSVLGLVRNISCRVFQFHADEPSQQNWPELKLGWRTVLAVVLGGIGAALSSAGGLGGGGLFVPLFNLLLQFDAKTSATLSNFMILGGSIANLWINLRQHHPHVPNKPLVDFDVVLLLEPNMLLGISAGVILNVILPDWVITALLTVTLGYMTIHSFRGGLRRWKRESNENYQRKIAAAAAASLDPEKNGGAPYVPAPDFHHHHLDSTENSSSSSSSSSSSDDDEIDTPSVVPDSITGREEDEENNQKIHSKASDSHGNSLKVRLENGSGVEAGDLSQPLLQRKESSQRRQFPVEKFLALGFTWFAFFLIQVLRGTSSNASILGLKACGFGYWLLTLLQIPLAFSITAWTIRRLRASHAESILVVSSHEAVQQQEDGFVLTPNSCTLLAWMALIAGLLGGLLGIGGGMIVNPLLLTVGMIPQVTAGTCASMVFFSSSMCVVQFSLMGRVPLDYAISAAVLCAIFSIFGIILVHRAIDRFNRASIIVFSVTAVMGVSSILMGGFGGFGVWEKYVSGEYMGFHNFC